MSGNLYILTGPSGSGKTMFSQRQLKDKSMGWPIVSPQEIRRARHGDPFCHTKDHLTWLTAQHMVAALFSAGHQNVILDSLALTVKHRDAWLNANWKRQFIVFDAPDDVCLLRISQMAERDGIDWQRVLERQRNRYVNVSPQELAPGECIITAADLI